MNNKKLILPILISFTILIIFSVFLLILTFISTYNIYKLIIEIITFISLIYLINFIIFVIVGFVILKKNKRFMFLNNYIRLNEFLIRPFMLFVISFAKKYREEINYFFIELNNYKIFSSKKYKSKDIIMIFPHCLQNHNCNIKITNNVENCKKCGKCLIGNIIDITNKYNIKMFIVTGGTAARKVVLDNRPKLIISVACERDLISGIIDVGKIPVLGIVNLRPNGPCFDTSINLEDFEYKIKQIVE